MKNHRLIDERSLALAQKIAQRLRRNPRLIDLARENLRYWMKTCSPRSIATLQEWQTILDGPIDEVINTLVATDERAVRLRQSNPFAGALPRKVRNDILLRFHSRDQAAT